jgi:hypothetical protein
MVPPRPGEQHIPERQVVKTHDGGEIHRTPSGAIREVHTPSGAIIHHEPGGERRVEIVRPGGRVIVANGTGRSGFIQRPLVSHGHTFVQRTYVVNGAPRAALYRPWSHEGRDYAVFMPHHYYHPTFYVWVRTPWERPVAYNWGWRARPWYGYYGGYFTPYPSYSSPAFWLTDFLIAATLEGAYLAQNTGSTALPPANMASAGMSPEVKDAIAQEVGRQMERAKTEQAYAQGGAPPSAPPPIFAADGPRIFLVSTGVLAYSGNQECPLTEGNVLKLVHTPAPGAEWADVQVLATRGSSCPVGSYVSIRTTDLQEMENSLEASMEQGLNKLQSDQGGVIPAMPAQAVGTVNAPYANDLVPDAGAQSELASAADEANRSEQGILNVGAQAPAPQASGATVALGMTLAQVEGALGRPKSSVDLGAKQIYVYSDLKVTFINGRVSDVQ